MMPLHLTIERTEVVYNIHNHCTFILISFDCEIMKFKLKIIYVDLWAILVEHKMLKKTKYLFLLQVLFFCQLSNSQQ